LICLASTLRGETNGVNVIGLEIPRYQGHSNRAYVATYLRFFAMASSCALKMSRVAPYDVVVVCTMPDAAVLCALGPRFYGARVLLDIHDTMPELYMDKFNGRFSAIGARLLMAEERASAWLADRVLAVHELHRERLEQAGVPHDKIDVVMNLPDPRIFYPREPAVRDNRREFRLICHGTMTRRLGIDLALEAVHHLRDRIPELQLKIVGSGDYLSDIQHAAARLGLESRVTFIPFVAIEDLPGILADGDVGIVPNRPSNATNLMLPTKLLEYAALRIPAIASRLRTIEHYFTDETVRFFAPGDAASLAAAIEDLYQHPEKRDRLAHNAAGLIERLSWNDQRDQFYEAIDSLLADAQVRRGRASGLHAS
jgi:glycosyltransferase involved in cell wall biosynthesis